MTLRTIVQLHYGPRQWVYLPYALILSGVVLLGFADDQTPAGLWYYFVVISLFVIQLVLPTIAGWVAAFAGWLGLWLTALVIVIFDPPMGALSVVLVVALAAVSLVPLYIFRPRLSDAKPVQARTLQ
ncbi:MAG: hypothetical protein ACLQKA_15290 [Bryobacteraceae bacterium]